MALRSRNLSRGISVNDTALSRGRPERFRGMGLKLWVRADFASLSGSNVTTLLDQSGNANNPAQVTASLQPTKVAGAQNNRPCARFDGVDDFMDVAFTLAQPTHVWFAGKMRSLGAAGSHDALFDGKTIAGILLVTDSTPQTILHAGTNVTYNQAFANGVANWLSGKFNGASSALSIRGTQVASGDASTHSADGVTIGSVGGGTAARTAAEDFYEMIIFSQIQSDSISQRIDHYISAEYGI